MATITVRNLPESVVKALKELATMTKKSMEQAFFSSNTLREELSEERDKREELREQIASALSKLVDDCIVRQKNENQNGWWPTQECGGGEDRFIRERKRFIESLK